MKILSDSRISTVGLTSARLIVPGLVGALSLVSSSSAVAQSMSFGFPRVVHSADAPYSVHAADLDGDGDVDVLSAAAFGNRIYWSENLGGGAFGPRQVITSLTNAPLSVFATDLDGDGDADVLSASFFDAKIAWYENLGGGSFGPQQVITFSANGARSVYATDLDGDGDADVLSASALDSKIAWYENLGGGSFGPQQVVTSIGVDFAISVFATDLDGDGDADVLSASADNNRIAWYENFGGGLFGPQERINLNAPGAASVFATDLDGDGDADVLSASQGDDTIAWYPNRNNGGALYRFGAARVLTTSADNATSVYATDLDGDGDADVLSASAFDGKIAYYENLGGGSFSSQQVITDSARLATCVYATDLDGDGDADVLSASDENDEVAWYENDSAPLTNDECDTATAIIPGVLTSFDTTTATPSLPAFTASCSANGSTSSNDVWFKFTAPADYTATATTCGTAAYDTKIAVYDGSCGALTLVGCNDFGIDCSGFLSEVNFTAVMGTEYFIRIGGRESVDYGAGQILVTDAPWIGSSVCLGNANSTGVGAAMAASGSTSVGDNDVTLIASDLPLNTFALIAVSSSDGFIANPGGSQGDLCLGSPVGRYNSNIMNSGSTGSFQLPLDLTRTPTPSGLTAVAFGETWYWQGWYRDIDGSGIPTSNFTGAVSVTFF